MMGHIIDSLDVIWTGKMLESTSDKINVKKKNQGRNLSPKWLNVYSFAFLRSISVWNVIKRKKLL